MKMIFLTLLFALDLGAANAQSDQNLFVVITVEKTSTSSMHPFLTDYWIMPTVSSSEEELIPLYIDGFSKTDIDECCVSDTLILFNFDSNENFSFDDSFKRSLANLRTIVAKKRQSVQSIKRKWSDGYRELVNIYITPIKGHFCICELKHKDGNENIGYIGKVAVPSGQFELYNDFYTTQEFRAIRRLDYSRLPFMSLQTIQQ